MADSPKTYEEEQAQLGGESDDLHIDVPQEMPEVNPEVFKDVEPMLFRGFLHISAEINDVPFVFKSLNHHEFNMVNLLAPMEGGPRAMKRFYSTFLAYGVFMANNSNILVDRDRFLPELMEMFDGMGDSVINKIVRYLSEINRRANRAVTLTEAFTMENLSRLRWAQLRGLDLTGVPVTGITGTQSLGLNWAQLTWRALNYYEDVKETSEREWENSKFVASAMAGKGMSKVHSQDKRRREQEKEARLARRDKILRFACLGEAMEQEGQTDKVPVIAARTVAELAKQLENDLKGEKDWHDLVVDSYEKRAQEERRQREEHLQEIQKDFDSKFGNLNVVGTTDMTGVTPEEVAFQVNHRRQLAAQRLAAQTHPELDPKNEEFINKWESVSKDNVPMAPTSNRPAGKPFKVSR